MNVLRIALIPALLVMMWSGARAQASCESLLELALPNARIDTAIRVSAGDYSFDPGIIDEGDVNPDRTGRQSHENLPAFCRIAATLTPSTDSDIKIEVWMPVNSWNAKFQAVGNGGWAGTISYGAMAQALRAGYATTSTDTGHSTRGGSFVAGHPEKLVDFAWRSEHEMTVKAKEIIAAYYGEGPRFSYWNGCSTGGRQGLMEATRFPDDFDGIVAGAPANPRSLRGMWKLQLAKWLDGDPARGISEDKVSMLQEEVLSYCDQMDGIKDRLIDNPLACKFNYENLLCANGDADKTCLTAPQIETVRRVMSPATLADGTTVYPGFAPGSEGGWASFVGSDSYQVDDNFQYVVYPDQEWDWRTFNADKAMPAALKADQLESVLSADLSAYTSAGGKLIIYHGWSDPRVSALGSIEYHARVMQETRNAEDSVRMFLAPGMGHCRGGDAPNVFDTVSALDAWVEGGNAPTQILATQYQPSTNTVVRTRPLCPYPQVARYQGNGSFDEAENFTCVTP